MKKRLLTIALLAVLTLSACGGGTSEVESVEESETTTEVSESESEVSYSVSISNKDAFADWHVGDDDIRLSLTLDPQSNITTEMTNGNLVITSSNPEVVYVSGQTAQAIAEGEATITVTWHDATDSVDVSVGAKVGISRSEAYSLSDLRAAITAGTVVSGDTVITYGRITAAMYPSTDGDLYAGVYLTDGEAGVMLYSGSLSTLWDSLGLAFGQDIIVTGEYSPYNGLSEIKITDAEILSENDSVSVSDTVIWEPTASEWSAAGEEMTGRVAKLDLVYQSGTFDSTTSHQTLTFAFASDTSTTVTVYCNYHIGTAAMTELQTIVNGLSVGTSVTITSVVSYYSGLQLGPVYTYMNGEVVTPASLWEVGTQVPTQNVTVTLEESEIEVGKTTQATATVDAGAYGTVTWTSSDESVATVDELGVVTAVGAGTATITATAVDAYTTDADGNPVYASGSADITVVAASGPYAVSEFVDGGTYVLGVYQGTNGYDLFFNGAMTSNGYYGDVTTDYESAVAVTVNSVEGGYTLSFVDGDGTTQYIYFLASGNYMNFAYTTDASVAVLTYNSEYNTFTQYSEANSADYYFGTYSANDRISASNISYAATSYVSHLYDYKVAATVADPVSGTQYYVGFDNGTNIYYDTGAMNGYYGATVTEQADAVLYTATYVEGSGWTLYNGSTYISVSVSGSYYNVAYSSDPYYFDYDEANHAFTSTIDDVTVAYGGRGTYTTSGFYNVATYGSSMYYAHCYEVISYPSIKGLTLSASAESVYVGETVSVSASYYPTCIESADLTWESSDTAVATVADGVVTGVAEGSVTITATTESGVSGSVTLTVAAAPAGYATETVVAADLGYANSDTVSDITGAGYTLAWVQNSASNPAKYYTSGTAIRCYAGSSLVFTPVEGYQLVSIEITYQENSTDYSGGTCTYDNATASVADYVITITPTDGTAAITMTTSTGDGENIQLRVVSYTVTYMAA